MISFGKVGRRVLLGRQEDSMVKVSSSGIERADNRTRRALPG